ncbi:MAG: helix-turn-helix domain-containing protein [Cyanobacteria bacterium P01_A01_bin.116]
MPLESSTDKEFGDKAFGLLLKYWRSQRNFSQLDLSMASDVSQRHISFIESGRAQPSRMMVLKLVTVLDVPLRQQNKMLTTAGFAPVYSEFDLDAPEVAPIRRAIEFTLKQQAPYPALVMDRYWNQLKINNGTKALLGWLLAAQEMPEDIGPNLMKLMLHPQGVKKHVTNWDAIAPHLIHRVHRETLAKGQDEPSQRLFDELLTYPDVQALWKAPIPENWQLPLLTVNFEKENRALSFFTTLTTLGTPQDITLQELRLECMFPADETTQQFFDAGS